MTAVCTWLQERLPSQRGYKDADSSEDGDHHSWASVQGECVVVLASHSASNADYRMG